MATDPHWKVWLSRTCKAQPLAHPAVQVLQYLLVPNAKLPYRESLTSLRKNVIAPVVLPASEMCSDNRSRHRVGTLVRPVLLYFLRRFQRRKVLTPL